MSENSSEKESFSTIKWVIITIIASYSISLIVPQFTNHYHFIRHGGQVFRTNTHTGKFERLEEWQWVDVAETPMEKDSRLEHKKWQEDFAKRMRVEEKEKDTEAEEITLADFESLEDPSMEISGRRGY